MRTFRNSPKLKAAFLAEITKHEAQDGYFKGSAIGCSPHSLNVLQGKIGWPVWLAHLEDTILENLPHDLATTWPRRLAEAVPVGAVIDAIVLAKILRWMLADSEFGVRFATDDKEIRGYIDGVIAGFDAEIVSGGQATAEEREAAARAAWHAWGARAANAARAAWSIMDAWDTWIARDACDAWAVMDAWAAIAGSKADAFFPALSLHVLTLLRELPATVKES